MVNKREQIYMKLILTIFTVLALSSCSSGGGSDSGSNDDNSNGGNSGSNSNKTAKWEVVAGISQDGCGERIDDVNQTFTVVDTGNGILVNSGLIDIAGLETSDGFTVGFQEANGSCSRSYSAEFSNVSSSSATVNLSATSNCNGSVCVNKWTGTATKVN